MNSISSQLLWDSNVQANHRINPFLAQVYNLKKSDTKIIPISIFNEWNYITKLDSVLISISDDKIIDKKYIDIMNNSGASIHQIISGEDYYSGFVQVDSLLNYFTIFSKSDKIYFNIELIANLDNEGPSLMNSDSYESGSVNNPNAGSGKSIAILDSGWEGYNITADNGFAPSTFTYFDCTSGTCVVGDMSNDGENDGCVGSTSVCGSHGTMVAQTVFDHAPAATYILYTIGSNSSRAAAINHASSQGVDIISCSLSGYTTGWNDNSGVLCSAINSASNDDVLMFFSAGNRNNGGHWQGNFVDNGNDFHIWSGNSILNTVSIGNGVNFTNAIQWNSDTDAYDADIVDVSTNQVLASSGTFNGVDVVTWTNTTGGVVNVGLRIESKTSATPMFETHFTGSAAGGANSYTFFSTSNQTTSPGNCTNNENLNLVGAVNKFSYNNSSPNAMNYSSIGPTNQNNMSVNITGPTNTSVIDYYESEVGELSTFGGTSCATPNCAGAAAAFWSKYPSLTVSDVSEILRNQAANYKDWGTSGSDNTFGYGGMFLNSYDIDNIFLHQGNGLNGTAPSNGIYPWDNLKDVDNLAPVDKKVIMLTHDFISAPKVLSKKMRINAVGTGTTSKRVE